MSLYEITEKYLTIFNEAVDEETGEFREGALEALEGASDDLKEKSITIASFIKNIEAEEVAIDAAICAMQHRQDKLVKRRKAVQAYLKDNMERTGITEISCPYFDVKIRKCPSSVEVVDEKFIPERFWRKKETFAIDKVSIKQKLQAGEEIPGVKLTQGTRLDIR